MTPKKADADRTDEEVKSNCEAERAELAYRVYKLEYEKLNKAYQDADAAFQTASLAHGRARANLLMPVMPFNKAVQQSLITALVNYIDLTAKLERARAERDVARAAMYGYTFNG